MQPSRLPTSPTEVEPEKLWNTRTVNSVTVSRSDMPLHESGRIRTCGGLVRLRLPVPPLTQKLVTFPASHRSIDRHQIVSLQ